MCCIRIWIRYIDKRYHNVEGLKLGLSKGESLPLNNNALENSLADVLLHLKQIKTYNVEFYPYLTSKTIGAFERSNAELKGVSFNLLSNSDKLQMGFKDLMQSRSIKTVKYLSIGG